MPIKAKKKPSGKPQKLSTKQTIDRLMQMIQALPEQVKDLPEHLKSRKHWEQTFSSKNWRGQNVMEMLCELPAFTNLAPKSNTTAAWQKVFERHMGLEQVAGTLRSIHSQANEKDAKRPKVVRWRDRFGKDEVVQRVRPKEHFDYIHNPHRGTTTFQRFQGEDTYPSFITADTYGPVTFPPPGKVRDNVKYIPRTTLTYCRWPWAWLEPQKGKFNWDLIDNTLKAAKQSGQTAQLRFQPYTLRLDYAKNPPKSKRHPEGSSVNVPDWYWDTGAPWVEQGVYARHEPDSNDPRYLEHFGDFIRAFAERYDGHPDLESIDMAYAGFWGESGGNSTAETAHKLTDIYLASFKKTMLLSMLGTPGCAHASQLSKESGHPVGWRADCFGDLRKPEVPEVPRDLCFNHTYDCYPREINNCGLKDNWKVAPVTMETCGNVATWVMSGYDIDEIIEHGYKYHMSVFMPKNAFFPERALEKLIEFDKKIGYRYALRQMLLPLEAKRGSEIKVSVFGDNVGCAPIYRPYKLALRFKQGNKSHVVPFKEDIRKWLPGHNYFEETIQFPQDVQPGEVKVALGMVDETNTPRVWWAIEGKLDEGWHPLTSMDFV
ncbi:MAG TPA: DUF4832 domain-containing protein [Planctomycetota bacterium]|nr:DUF4832 domain-containing protein [Planctomycetota bacterium]